MNAPGIGKTILSCIMPDGIRRLPRDRNNDNGPPDGSIRRAMRTSGDSSEVFGDGGSCMTIWLEQREPEDRLTWESVSTRDFVKCQEYEAP